MYGKAGISTSLFENVATYNENEMMNYYHNTVSIRLYVIYLTLVETPPKLCNTMICDAEEIW